MGISLVGICAEAYKAERNVLSTIKFKSAKADMGYKDE